LSDDPRHSPESSGPGTEPADAARGTGASPAAPLGKGDPSRLKWITAVIVLLMAILGFIAWRNSTEPAVQEQAAPPSMPPDAIAPMAGEPADPGIEWTAPAGWTTEGARSMRLATYTIPGAGGAGPAQCAVFYFGPGQGGTPEANIDRWLGEFVSPENPRRSTRKVRGLEVSVARVRGTYQSHGGATAPDPASGADQQLIGAIVEGPQGPVFFKLTGPANTVDAAAADFDRMIGSVRKK
jgi:hypothetical protein